MNCHPKIGPAQLHQPTLRGDNQFCRGQCQAVTPSPAKDMKESCASPLKRQKFIKIAKITYICYINTLRNQNKYPNKFGFRVALHVFWEFSAFWSTEAWGQRCCHEFLFAELRMAAPSMGMGMQKCGH